MPIQNTSIVAHTPGPWQRHYSSSTPDEWVIGGEGFAPVIAFVTRDEDDADMPGATVEANARLITAAPELLNELKRAALLLQDADREWFGGNGSNDSPAFQEMMSPILAAIAKAEGRES